MILLFLRQIQKLKDTSLVSLEKKKKKTFASTIFSKICYVSAQSFMLAIWFACVPACTSAITQVSLTSLHKLHCISWKLHPSLSSHVQLRVLVFFSCIEALIFFVISQQIICRTGNLSSFICYSNDNCVGPIT